MSDDRCPRCRLPYTHANGDGHHFDHATGRYVCSVGMEDAMHDYWTGEAEPPRYTCVDDVRVIHEGDEIEDCDACLPRTVTRTQVGAA